MPRRRTLPYWVVLVVVLLVIAACAPTVPPAGEGPSAAPTEAKVAAVAEAVAEPAAEKVTLNFWTWFQGEHYEENLKHLISTFQEKYPNVEVKYEALTWQEGGQKISVALASGEPPDVMFQYFSPDYIDTGYIMPLDDIMTEEEKEDFGDASIESYTYGGKVYGFPVWKQLWNIGANKELLDEAGIDWKKIQAEGWTYEEFEEVARQLYRDKSKYSDNPQWGFVFHGTYENAGLPEMWQIWNANSGIPYQVDPEGNWMYDDPRALDNLKRIINYSVEGGICPPETPALGRGERAHEMFDAWEAAMVARSGPYIVPNHRLRCENIAAGKEEGYCIEPLMLPFPHLEGEEEYNMGSVPGHVVFTHDKDKGKAHYEMAIEFARHLSSAEGTCRFSADLYELPARESGIEYCYENGILSRDDPNLQFFGAYFDRAPVVRVLLDPDLSTQVSKFQADVLYPNYEAALLGTLSAEEAFNNMVEGTKMLKEW